MDRTVAIELENSVEIDTVYIPYFPGKPFHTVLDDPIVVYGERRVRELFQRDVHSAYGVS